VVLNKLVRDKHPAETVESARRLKEKMEKGSAAPLDLSHVKALVVDDFMPNLNMAAGLLRKYKIQVDCASSGLEAIDLIKKGETAFDFIFMDHLMPDMNGIETVQAIRGLGTVYAKSVPIFAVTADDTGNEQMFLDNGFQAVLPKPLSVSKLDAFIKKWFYDKMTHGTAEKNEGEKDMKIEIPGVDEAKVLDLYGGDMEIFLPVLRSYASAIPAALDKMRTVSAQSLPEYVVSVHGVKSTSDSIGAEEARRMAYELEALAKAGDISSVLAKNEALIHCVETLLVGIQNWLKQLDAK
jgi:CheY-like chemotaxis protein